MGKETTGARRAERLDGLGERVAAVAHELKVPLSLIVGSLESLDSYVSSLIDRVEELEAQVASSGPRLPGIDGQGRGTVYANAAALVRICREGADRLEHVVQEITAYARGGAPPAIQAKVDVARVLRTAVDLMARSIPNAPPVRLEVGDVPQVRADEEALTRILVNLLRNAFDALAGHAAPLVRVTTALAGAMVEIRVADNGPGIAVEDRARVFEPFFSGKAHGIGLGLGLAIAKELVEAQHGTIELAPCAPGLPFASGTAFVIRLPVAP
jgi:two-component system sensor histidine kinase HupT/HoxJ